MGHKNIAVLDGGLPHWVNMGFPTTKKHLEVDRFVHPDIFEMFKEKGLAMGFKVVESGPLVRSSYHADEQAKMYGVESNYV